MSTLLMLMASVLIQQQTPTATVNGDVVTVAADIAWIDPAAGQSVVQPLATVQGTILIGPTMLASRDGVEPVAWKLPPGSYKVTAFGYPSNRSIPVRKEIVLDIVISNPTRPKLIRDALQKYTEARTEAAIALTELNALKPTKDELRTAALP